MRHLSQKDIIRLLIDDSAKLSKLRTHVDHCPACAEKYNRAQQIIYKKNVSTYTPVPSGKLLERIIAAYTTSIHQSSSVRQFRTIKRWPVFAACAAALFIAITIGLYLMFGTSHRDELLPAYDIAATRSEGEKETTFTISAGDIITTRKSERVRIALDNRMEINLFSDTILGIEKSQSDKRGKSRNVECNLSYGIIHARIIDKTGIRLAFKTPKGIISALGTEFIIRVTTDKSEVYLKEGTLSIKHVSGEIITLYSGVKCELTAAITTSPMLPNEFERILISAGDTYFAKPNASKPLLETSSDAKDTNRGKAFDSNEKDTPRFEYRTDIKNDAKKEIRAAQKESRKYMRHRNK